jgi:hypothetical protein
MFSLPPVLLLQVASHAQKYFLRQADDVCATRQGAQLDPRT